MTENKLQKNHKQSRSKIFWLMIVAGVALMERLLVILLYQPVTYSDTPSYRRLANTVLNHFTNYDGTRTPGYPVFLALTGTDQRAWLVQLLMGLITTLLLFYIGWKLTDKTWFGGVIALAHTLNLGQLFFESNLLTESVTTFLLIVTMAGVLVWLLQPKPHNLYLGFCLGLNSGITLLVRPLFIYLPFLLLVFLWLESRLHEHGSKQAEEATANVVKALAADHPWHRGVAFFLPVVLLLGGWVFFIHKEFNQWSLTTMTGYHLVQHTGNYFEYVPDEYASLRNTYIKYRDAHIAKYGTQTNAIWDAIPEMSRVSGYSFYGLSRVLTRISIQLIVKHPLLFIKSAIMGWWMFWRAPVYWSAEAFKLPMLTPVINLAVQIQRVGLIAINLFFVIASLYFAFIAGLSALRRKVSPLARRFHNHTQVAFLWMLLTNIWIASILQTLLDHGDNPRFLVPMQSLVVLWVGIFILQIVINRPNRASTSPQPKSK